MNSNKSSKLSREMLLAEAYALTNKPNYTKMDGARAHDLIRLAESQDGVGSELRRLRIAKHAKDMNVRSDVTSQDVDYELNFREYLRHGGEALEPEARALGSGGTGAAGSYLCPQDFQDTFQNALIAYDAVFDAARIVETPHGNTFNFPLGDDTASSATIVAENQISILNVDSVFANLQFGKCPTWRSGHIRASLELANDNNFDLGSVLAELAAQRMARGIGSQMVTNLLSSAVSGATSAGASAVVPDDLLALMGSLDNVYGQRGSFVMNLATLLKVIGVKGSTSGNYMLDVELDDSGRPTLFGRTVFLSPSMPAATHANKAVAFGDMNWFMRRQVRDSLSIKTLVERYAEYGQIAYEVFWRCDSALAVPTVAPIPVKVLTQA